MADTVTVGGMRFTTRVPLAAYPTPPEPGAHVLLYTEGNPRPRSVKCVSATVEGDEIVLDLSMPYTHVVAPGGELPRSPRIATRVSHGPVR